MVNKTVVSFQSDPQTLQREINAIGDLLKKRKVDVAELRLEQAEATVGDLTASPFRDDARVTAARDTVTKYRADIDVLKAKSPGGTTGSPTLSERSCGEQAKPQAPATRTVATESSESPRYSNQPVQNTFKNAYDLCKRYGPERAAKDLDVRDKSDLHGIARAYSMGSGERFGHRQAAYAGCVKGLMAFKAR